MHDKAVYNIAVGMTLTPAVLVMLGPRLFRADVGHRLKRLFQRKPHPPVEEVVGSGFWVRWSEAVMRRPWHFLIGALIVLLALAAPVLDMKTGSSGISGWRPPHPSATST